MPTHYVCEGWTVDSTASAALEFFKARVAGRPEEELDDEFGAVLRFVKDHGQSLDWIFGGDPVCLICRNAANSLRAKALSAKPPAAA